MASYIKWLRKHTVFDSPLPTRDREKALFCIARIIRDSQEGADRFYFEELEFIHLGNNVNSYSDMTLGLTTAKNIYAVWSGINTAADSRLIAHELGHYYFLKLFEGVPGRDKDWKNLPHYADNAGPPWFKEQRARYLSRLDWLLRREGTYLRIFMLDIPKLLAERDRIMEEIKAGTAPTGPNRYFTS